MSCSVNTGSIAGVIQVEGQGESEFFVMFREIWNTLNYYLGT